MRRYAQASVIGIVAIFVLFSTINVAETALPLRGASLACSHAVAVSGCGAETGSECHTMHTVLPGSTEPSRTALALGFISGALLLVFFHSTLRIPRNIFLAKQHRDDEGPPLLALPLLANGLPSLRF